MNELDGWRELLNKTIWQVGDLIEFDKKIKEQKFYHPVIINFIHSSTQAYIERLNWEIL